MWGAKTFEVGEVLASWTLEDGHGKSMEVSLSCGVNRRRSAATYIGSSHLIHPYSLSLGVIPLALWRCGDVELRSRGYSFPMT